MNVSALRRTIALSLALAPAGATLGVDAASLAIPDGPVTADIQPRRAAPLSPRIDPALARARGEVEVWVKLAGAPLAAVNGQNARTRGGLLSQAQREAHLRDLDSRQDELSAGARALGGEELGRVSRAHNAVAVRIAAARLADLASLPGVVEVRPVIHYEVMLSETVPYIGAAAAQEAGRDGAGTRVAVLDSGIDYTHFNLGGPGGTVEEGTGTTAAYKTAVATFPNPYFPSAKVIGGFDFLGSQWPNPDPRCGFNDPPTNKDPKVCRVPDPNPIDDGAQGGHGTHVSDILAGRSADGKHVGVAPGAQLYALKVCSSVSTSCNGVALLQAVDFALDPNGDGSMRDAVDVMNLSLGANYGQKEDDLTEALNQAVFHGVVVVAAAGNAANKPYIVSSPSAGPPVISVAQTQVPGARAIPLVVNSPASIAGSYSNTETVGWAPVDRAVTGDVAFVGRGCPAGSITPTNPADAYRADPAGKVALIDRGACSVSLKVDRAAKAGAIAVVIGLVAAGDAISFSFGGGDTFVPTLVITRATSNLVKDKLASGAVNVTISPANAIPLVGSMVSSSARGPSYSFQTIKPEIGAPGASVSAEFGTGTGQTAFGGTSGATPMIAGSAAILRGANPRLEPEQVKALLMNRAETQIFNSQAIQPGVLAPITRIGAGEVRVDRSLAASSAAWVERDHSAALSFGYRATSATTSFEREVKIQNFSHRAKVFQVTPTFRYASKAASGAVEVLAPSQVAVPRHGEAEFEVRLVVHPEKLPPWNLNGGSQGGNGPRLDGLEMDGYLELASGTEKITLPWHVLPHRAAALFTAEAVKAGAFLNVFNAGVADGRVEVLSLTGQSPRIPRKQLPRPGENFAVVDLKAAGVRGDASVIQFGITTFGSRAHPNYPAEFDVYVDANRDGVPDFVFFNAENGGFGATGQNLVFVAKLKPDGSVVTPPGVQAFFFADADLNSSNMIFTAPLAEVGLTPSTQFDFVVLAFDNYFTGNLTDSIGNVSADAKGVLHLVNPMTYTPGTPRFTGTGIPATGVPAHGVSTLSVAAVTGGDTASPSQTGLLLMYRDVDARRESQSVNVIP